jgi:hypothetical protein
VSQNSRVTKPSFILNLTFFAEIIGPGNEPPARVALSNDTTRLDMISDRNGGRPTDGGIHQELCAC